MSHHHIVPAILIVNALSLGCVGQAGLAELQTWVVDPLHHVLDGATPASDAPEAIELHAARGEFENGQFVVSTDKLVSGLQLSIGSLSGPGGAALRGVSVHPLGRLRLMENTRLTATEDLVGKAPVNIPDSLLNVTEFDLHPGYPQPVWVKVRVPRDALPGVYKGHVRVSAGGASRQIPVTVRVYEAIIPRKCHLDVVYWVNWRWLPDAARKDRELQSEYWSMMLRDMVAHRQNTIKVPLFANIGGAVHSDIPVKVVEEGGEFRLDCSEFDRLVSMAFEAGIEYITPGQIAHRTGGWNGKGVSSSPVNVFGPDGGKLRTIPALDVYSPEFRELFTEILPLFYKHLEAKGWRDRVLFQHLADEPLPNTGPAYNHGAAILREAVPDLIVTDASRLRDLTGGGWIPTLSLWDSDKEFYKEAESKGGLVWQYTCDNPRGKYPNFFPDYPLIRARMLAWANWRYAIPGYLNWNYNNAQAHLPEALHMPRETKNPNALEFCSYVVSSPEGPTPSVRFEACRDGREDFELLRIVALRDPAKSRAIARQAMPDLRQCIRDIHAFRRIRRDLLEAASAACRTIKPAELESKKIVWDYVPEETAIAVPPLERQAHWKLTYAPGLVQAAAIKEWEAVSGQWSVKDGWLVAKAELDPKTEKPRIGDKIVVCREEFEGDMRLEYDARSDDERPGDLSAILHCDRQGFVTGYFFGFGSDDNAFSKVMVEASELIIREGAPIQSGKTHHVVIQRDGDVLSQFIDGKLMLVTRDLMPLRGPGHRNFGFYLWTDGQVGNIRLYTKTTE